MLYDISIKKVAVAGGSGELGSVVLKELLESNLFEITVLTRQTSHSFPASVKVATVDYSSVESLTEALQGQDALVSTLGTAVVSTQKLLIDAAVRAEVKRIIPSEFGCNLHNAKTKALPCFAAKVEIEQYLNELAEKGLTSYTLVFCGPFLDWGLRNGLFFDFKNRKATVYDGGNQLISTSKLNTIGKAVRRILTHPRETSDRAVWIKDMDITLNQLLRLAQALNPNEKWEIAQASSSELEKASLEELHTAKHMTPKAFVGFITRAFMGEGYGAHFEHVHNSTLGIKGMTEPDLEELMRSIFAGK